MHPNTMKGTKTWVLGPMGWIRCVRCEKLQRDFVARMFAIIAPVNPFCTEFHEVTKQSQMHPNTMQHTKTWVYGPMGPIRCVRCEKLQRDFVARSFAIIALVNPFAPSFVQLRYDTKYTRTLWNAPKHEFRVQWDASSAFVAKNYVTSWHELLH